MKYLFMATLDERAHALVWSAAARKRTTAASEVCHAFARDARKTLPLSAATVHVDARGGARVVVLYTAHGAEELRAAFDGRTGMLPFTLVLRDGTGCEHQFAELGPPPSPRENGSSDDVTRKRCTRF